MPFCKSCHMPSCKLISPFNPHHSRLAIEKHNGTVVQIYYACVSKPTSDHAQHRRSLMLTILHASKCNRRIWLIRHLLSSKRYLEVHNKAPKLASRAELGKYLMGVDIDKKILNCNMMTIEFNNKTLLTSIKLSFSKAQLILKG